MSIKISSREEMSKSEMLRSPIFLYQVRRTYPTDDFHGGDYDYCSDCMAVYSGTEEQHYKDHQRDDYEPPTEDELIENGALMAYWETVYVFYSREEGEDFGKKNSHNDSSWRVFSVAARGNLEEILNAAKIGDKE